MVHLKPGKETICWAEGIAAEGSHTFHITDKSPLPQPCQSAVVEQLSTY